MTRIEFLAYQTKYAELQGFQTAKNDLVALKAQLEDENQTVRAIEVHFTNGNKDAAGYRLTQLATDLLASIDDEITALTSSITTAKSQLLALTASQPASDSALDIFV